MHRVYDFVARLGAGIIHPPREDNWTPGCYCVLFTDPGGIRLEVNFVPGKGNPDPSIAFPLPAALQQRPSGP